MEMDLQVLCFYPSEPRGGGGAADVAYIIR